MPRTLAIAVFLLFSIGASAVSAQDAQAAIGIAGGLSAQGKGASDEPYLGPPFGGVATSVVVFVDRLTSTPVSWGIEASLAGNIAGTQSSRGANGVNTFDSHHHDSVFSGTVRYSNSGDHGPRIAVMGGAGVAHRETRREGTTRENSPPFNAAAFDQTVSTWAPAITGGAEAGYGLGPNLAIIAVGRLHYLVDKDRDEDGVVRRGVSSLVFRAGAGVLIRF